MIMELRTRTKSVGSRNLPLLSPADIGSVAKFCQAPAQVYGRRDSVQSCTGDIIMLEY